MTSLILCDPSTIAGPVDERVLDAIQARHQLDAAYLACLPHCHGAVPLNGTFKTASGQHQLAQFLTLMDNDSEMPGDARPHFDHHSSDERAIESVYYLTRGEHATSRALFGRFVPFATTKRGMCLDRAYVDLLCFDYREESASPAIVRWISDDANSAYIQWDMAPFDSSLEDIFSTVQWDAFIEPIAPDFSTFATMLGAQSE